MNLCLFSVANLFSFNFFWNPMISSVHLLMAATIQLHVITTLIIFWNPIIASANSFDNLAPYYIGDVAINCGYLGNSTALDSRQWFGDEATRSVMSALQPRDKSKSSTGDHRSLTADPIPYMAARASATQFYYAFLVNPGQKFIRLHFRPSSYRGFENARDVFTVRAGAFTLLRNFSASLAADALGVKYLVKEFCLNVGEDKYLNITFSPSQSTKQRNIYAFVNGIEIISMPAGLYYTPDGDLGASIVGRKNRYYRIDNSTALEMVQRLNIGGSSILPGEDFGMFRRWTEDANYLLTSELQPANHLVRGIKFTSIPAFTAPLKIYQTSWKTGTNGRAEKMHDFTWKISADAGFGYLVRLHFCDFELETTDAGQRGFSVLINNQAAETKADVSRLSGGTGVPIYRDYMVMAKGDKKEGKFDLFIALQSSDELFVGLLHGLEIFKLSSLDNNLASPRPVCPEHVPTSWNLKIRNLLSAFGRKNAIVTGITILLILLNLIVFKLRQIWEESWHEGKDTRAASSEQSCRRFSLAEIISATLNFSDALLIGKGGFGKVYKGFICGGSDIVAVKRLKLDSKQGAKEFWTEIETLSNIRHIHLVSLIGYCNEYQEMILVYEYMSHGTLADNIYKIGRNGKAGSALTWEQRLKICIGAARGLDYLHTGIEYGVIHRDVKDSNILLDENLVAKISDFGLSKLERLSESQSYVSTKVKGTFGYLDPEYIMTHKPTRKTDVYAFGIVLLVVLCGRPAVDRRIPWEPQSLLSLFQESVAKGDTDDIVDPCMEGKIWSESLKEFIRAVEKCTQPQPKKRPTMSQVVTSLEYALEKQQSSKASKSEEAAMSCQPCDGGIIQPFEMNELSVSPIHQESAISFLGEEINSKVIQNHELLTRRVDFQSIRKPVWVWPWGALRKKRKNSKKKDLLSEDLLISRFKISEIQDATDNFSNGRLIEDRQSWRLFQGYVGPLWKQCTIYQCKEEVNDEKFVQFSNELEMLLQLRHQNLVSMIGYCYHKPSAFVVYEYDGNTTLHSWLYDASHVPLSWIHRIQICIGVAEGLKYLHNGTGKTRIHGNLTPENILIDFGRESWPDGWTPLLSSFDLFSFGAPSSIGGNMGYIAPEPFVTFEFSEKSDVYSFGVVLLAVLCGRRSYYYDATRLGSILLIAEVKSNIIAGRLQEIIDSKLSGQIAHKCLSEFLKIALSCLLYERTERPTMGYIVEKLELSLRLQQNAEAAKQQDFKGKDADDFNLENINYQQLSNYFVADVRNDSTEVLGR